MNKTKKMTMTEMLIEYARTKDTLGPVHILMDDDEIVFSDLKNTTSSVEIWRRMGAGRFQTALRTKKDAWSIAIRAISMQQIFQYLVKNPEIENEISFPVAYGECKISKQDDGSVKLELTPGKRLDWKVYAPEVVDDEKPVYDASWEFYRMIFGGSSNYQGLLEKAAEALLLKEIGHEVNRPVYEDDDYDYDY